jgi:hypothetical protein
MLPTASRAHSSNNGQRLAGEEFVLRLDCPVQAQKPEDAHYLRINELVGIDFLADEQRDQIDLGRRDNRTLPIDDTVAGWSDENLICFQIAVNHSRTCRPAACRSSAVPVARTTTARRGASPVFDAASHQLHKFVVGMQRDVSEYGVSASRDFPYSLMPERSTPSTIQRCRMTNITTSGRIAMLAAMKSWGRFTVWAVRKVDSAI